MATSTEEDTKPSPIVVSPSQHFEGNDGPWSTFDLRVGTPEQYVRALVSTASPETIVVLSSYGCSQDVFHPVPVPASCAVSRGMMFNASASKTWQDQGNYSINHDGSGLEANLGYSQIMDFGLDTLGLGLVAGANGPTLQNQTLSGVVYPSPFYLGTFGLNSEPVNLTNLGNSSTPSYLTTLKKQKLIPSLSWSYTAGAIYRLKQVHGQLILGGYDDSRFVPNSVSFTMADDTTRDLVVALQSISYTGSTQASLLDSPINIYIDSTDPFLWLPESACKHFESVFGLTLDNSTGMYLLSDTHHSELQASGAEVAFHLSDVLSGGASMTIILPYAAFDLQAGPPLLGNSSSYYFPLKRAANESQFTLGRTFLQEAYLTADYERKRFNLSQCSWIEGATQHVVAITSVEDEVSLNTSSPSTLPSATPPPETNATRAILGTSAIVGIVVGVLASIAIIFGAFCLFRRRKQTSTRGTGQSPEGVPPPSGPPGAEELPELKWPEDHDQEKLLQANLHAHELAGSAVAQVYELSGSDVRRAELDSSALSRPRKRTLDSPLMHPSATQAVYSSI
ncbi:acid protease [Thozetella sp. PMI_491]|nr:acid protease [Thozetella sp. PMI_491]